MKKEITTWVKTPFTTIQHSQFKMKRDILAANSVDGFIPMSYSNPSGDKRRITINAKPELNIDSYYSYNKKGEIRRGNYLDVIKYNAEISSKTPLDLAMDKTLKVELIERPVNKHGCKFTLSVQGIRYDVYMPAPSIIASRIEEPKEDEKPKEDDDLEFYSIAEASRYFGVAINTIRYAVATRGEKAVKGYLFDYGWPNPYIVAVLGGGSENGK